MIIQDLLKLIFEKGASDLHLVADSPPQFRIDGVLVSHASPVLKAAEIRNLCLPLLSESEKKRFEETHECDFSLEMEKLGRFRINIYQQRGSVAGAFRPIPFKIPTPQQLGIPTAVLQLTERPHGLVLVTGPTGSGKSTTLASLIDKINSERHSHIITIEDPIEFVHEHKKSVVSQREIGKDSHTFQEALKYVLRQDPDVILIGEMRDLETISAALTISETGHLVFATLHTNSATQTLNRIIDVFPAHQQSQVRTVLSFVLEGIVSQQLVAKVGGGRALAMEMLIPTNAVRNLIREDKLHQVPSQMQVGQTETGMQTMNQSLIRLIQTGAISREEALSCAFDTQDFKQQLAGIVSIAQRKFPESR